MFAPLPLLPMCIPYRHAADRCHVYDVGDGVDDLSQPAYLLDAHGGDVADARQQLQEVVEALKNKQHTFNDIGTKDKGVFNKPGNMGVSGTSAPGGKRAGRELGRHFDLEANPKKKGRLAPQDSKTRNWTRKSRHPPATKKSEACTAGEARDHGHVSSERVWGCLSQGCPHRGVRFRVDKAYSRES